MLWGDNATASSLWANWSLGLIGLTILYYDYLITLPEEVLYIWHEGPRISSSFCLFIVVRYLALAMHIPSAYALLGTGLSNSTYVAFQKTVHFYASAALQVVVGIVFVLRIHALYRSRAVLASILLLGAGVVTVAVWASVSPHSGKVELMHANYLPGCNPLTTEYQGQRFAITWSGVVVFDVVVFILTILKTLKTHGWGRSTLWYTFFWDGALYFAVLFVVNSGNIMTFLFAPPVLKGANAITTTVLSSTLASRLLISIRKASSQLNDIHTHDNSEETGVELSIVVTPSMMEGRKSPSVAEGRKRPWRNDESARARDSKMDEEGKASLATETATTKIASVRDLGSRCMLKMEYTDDT
ncbi:hypothetical protein K488DRAFT_88606 [Vararia minispora EC-137]|uniref:Uncharacterized protein n=1 Tax=Vararia minispora EC-137 TaxID=1314806 RepID=A0ACB8QDA5_9AGAM|nr:hypothetical protein K488DRAFT_88606 [Vararia minispora EC-137]